MLFLEAKWLYNHIISTEKIFEFNTKGIKEVEVLNKEKEKEIRKLKYLGSQMKQEIHDKIKQSIYDLSSSKKKGRKVGKLKFKSFINCIPLKQFGITYQLDKEKEIFSMQGFRKNFKLHGFEQFENLEKKKIKYEIANATFNLRNEDYYLKVTTFQEKQNIPITHQDIGIDFGIKDSLTFSNGVKIKVKLENCKRLKKLQRKLRNKKKKGTKNRNKLNVKIAKKYQKITNKKNDISNKVVSYLNTNFDNICVQDDSFNNWKRNKSFGKTVQSSILGRTLSRLKNLNKTKVLERYVPSTSECYLCGTRNEIKLSDRIFICKECGHVEDRDIKSAKYILYENLKIPVEHRKYKLVESVTSLKMLEYFEKNVPNIFISYT